jgi:hypothetical protein
MTVERQNRRLTEEGVQEDLQRQPQLLLKLAENAFVVAESLRDNYFKNTARFVTDLRQAMNAAAQGKRADSILTVHEVKNAAWATVQGEVVTFIDGGVGHAQFGASTPILLRVGSYCVRTGERRLAEREQFGYYPVILGDLEGGSKGRKDFTDIVRITAELLGGLSALERTPDLRMLMFHGPLVYLMSGYAGHSPFTEADIDLFLRQYAPEQKQGGRLKEEFLRDARLDIYPRMTDRSEEWSRRRVFEPLAWIAWLYRKLIRAARIRTPTPIVAGVVEQSASREFSEHILLERVFRGLRKNERADYFNQMYGRADLTSPKALLERLGYTDSLLLAALLRPGQFSEPWEMAKYDGLGHGDVTLPGEVGASRVNFAPLRLGSIGFPRVRGSYICVSETTDPVRIEVFDELDQGQIAEAARRVYLYARLLPGYGFPVGLDIVDKFAKVPSWLTEAYGKLIRFHLGVGLQKGEISDSEMRRVLVQAIYMTRRDWLFRPGS